jgi:hypothetical protein
LADFRQLPSQRSELSPQDTRPLCCALLWKCQREIAHAHLPQTDVQQINYPADTNSKCASEGKRQDTENFDKRPSQGVLKSLPHSGSVTVSLAKIVCQTRQK